MGPIFVKPAHSTDHSQVLWSAKPNKSWAKIVRGNGDTHTRKGELQHERGWIGV